MLKNFLLIGHRGTRIDFDENTLDAFEIAWRNGAKYIELDVRELKDGNLVVIHDSSLDRTTNSSGLIKDFNYKEIKNVETKIKKSKIPFLSEVLEIFKERLYFIIELKEENIWRSVLNLILNKKLRDICTLSGRNLSILELIKREVPEINMCYNITKGKGLTLSEFLEGGIARNLNFIPELVSLRSDLITSQFIEICHINNILALAWDFIAYKNPIEKIKNLINIGIDGILFDNYKNIKTIDQWLETL